MNETSACGFDILDAVHGDCCSRRFIYHDTIQGNRINRIMFMVISKYSGHCLRWLASHDFVFVVLALAIVSSAFFDWRLLITQTDYYLIINFTDMLRSGRSSGNPMAGHILIREIFIWTIMKHIFKIFALLISV